MTQDQGDGGRYAPPQAPVDDVRPPGAEADLAGRGARLGAAIIDTIVLLALLGVMSLFTPWNPFKPSSMQSWGQRVMGQLVGIVLFLLVQGYPLVTKGQTLGKMALGLRIVRPDGSLPTAGRLLGVRYGSGFVISMIPGVGQIYGLIDSLLIFRASRRCVHDELADTIVVKR